MEEIIRGISFKYYDPFSNDFFTQQSENHYLIHPTQYGEVYAFLLNDSTTLHTFYDDYWITYVTTKDKKLKIYNSISSPNLATLNWQVDQTLVKLLEFYENHEWDSSLYYLTKAYEYDSTRFWIPNLKKSIENINLVVDLTEYVGKYDNRGFEVKNDTLVFLHYKENQVTNEYRLSLIEKDHFKFLNYLSTIRFTRADGVITGYTFNFFDIEDLEWKVTDQRVISD